MGCSVVSVRRFGLVSKCSATIMFVVGLVVGFGVVFVPVLIYWSVSGLFAKSLRRELALAEKALTYSHVGRKEIAYWLRHLHVHSGRLSSTIPLDVQAALKDRERVKCALICRAITVYGVNFEDDWVAWADWAGIDMKDPQGVWIGVTR